MIMQIENEEYHSLTDSISKTGLWTVYNKTPGHFKYAPKKTATHLDFGQAIHTAILEPEELEGRFVRGPVDRRGNKWKDSELYAASIGATLLTESHFEGALLIRESAETNSMIRNIRAGAIIEHAGFWTDERTGVKCRCKPDVYNPDMNVIGDIKSTTDARPAQFVRAIERFGYHFGEAFYSDGWAIANQKPIDGFVFIAIESAEPYMVATYELGPEEVMEGRAQYEAALDIYAQCEREQHWYGYPDAVMPLKLSPWSFKLTRPQDYREPATEDRNEEDAV